MTDRAKIVAFYMQKLNDKDFEISDVRKDLERNKFDQEEIKVIVKLVDRELQSRLLSETTNRSAIDLFYVGVVLTFVGLIITIGTYTGLINMGDSFLFAYGPFFGGLFLLVSGIAKRKRV